MNPYTIKTNAQMLISPKSRQGPTVLTLRTIEAVLREAAVPMTRYKIRQALGNRVGQPTLDEALDYLAEHKLVYDEGPGGQVVWIATSGNTARRLRGH